MSLFDNQLTDKSAPVFAPSAEDAQRLAAMRLMLAQAGVGQSATPNKSRYPQIAPPTALESPDLFKTNVFERMSQLPYAHQQAPMIPQEPQLQELPAPPVGQTQKELGIPDYLEGLNKLSEEKESSSVDRIKDLLVKSGVAYADVLKAMQGLGTGAGTDTSTGTSTSEQKPTLDQSSKGPAPEGYAYNVGNLRVSGVPWTGKGPGFNGFETFDTPYSGARAMVNNLKSYTVHNPDITLGQAITKWAPPKENDTAAYIARVVKDTTIQPDMKLAKILADPDLAVRVLMSMGAHEKGKGLHPAFTRELFLSALSGTPPKAKE